MTFQARVKCLICRTLTDPTNNSKEETKNAEALNLLHNKLCTALKLEFSVEFQEWDFSDEPFPYCESCGQRLQRLAELIDQLRRIEVEISGSLATVSALVITSGKINTNAIDPLIRPKLGQAKDYFKIRRLQEKHNYFRNLIIKQFDPLIAVERCDSYRYPYLADENYEYELEPSNPVIKTEPAVEGFAGTSLEENLFNETEYKIDPETNVRSGDEPETIIGYEGTWTALSEAPALNLVSDQAENHATAPFTSAKYLGLVKSLSSKEYGVTFDEASKAWDLSGFKFKVVQSGYECLTCGQNFTAAKGRLSKTTYVTRHINSVHIGVNRNKSRDPIQLKLKTHPIKQSDPGPAEKPFPCGQCGLSFLSKGILESHYSRWHAAARDGAKEDKAGNPAAAVPIPKDIMGNNSRYSRVCEKCDKVFPSARTLYEHGLMAHPSAEFQCRICEAKFSIELRLKKHMLGHTEQTGKESFPCLLEPVTQGYPETPEEQTLLNETEYKYESSTNCINSGVEESEATTGLEEAWTSLSQASTLTLVSNGSESVVNPTSTTSTTSANDTVLAKNIPSRRRPFIERYDETFKTDEVKGFKFKKLRSGCFECSTCGHVSSAYKGNFEAKNIIGHIERVHVDNVLKSGLKVCEDCGKAFASLLGLYQHNVSTHRCQAHIDFKFQCNHCGAKFPNQFRLSLHVKRMHCSSQKSLKCAECGKSFYRKDHLEFHSRLHARKKALKDSLESPPIISLNIPGSTGFACGHCGAKFPIKSALESHVITHAADESGESRIIPDQFGNMSNRKKQSRKQSLRLHPDRSIVEPVFVELAGPTTTEEEGRVSETEPKIGTGSENITIAGEPEMIIGLEEAWNPLSAAPLPLTVISNAVERGENPSSTSPALPSTVVKPGQKVCKDCGDFFASLPALYQHRTRAHPSPNKLQCGHCGAKFKAKLGLTRHMIRHSEQKPYSCDECGKCFATNGELVVHSGMHARKRALLEDNNLENPTTSTFPMETNALVLPKEDPHSKLNNEQTFKTYELNGFKYREFQDGSYDCCTCGHVTAIPKFQRPKKSTNIRRHIKAVHMKNSVYWGGGSRKCEECGKLCSSKNNLYQHRVTAHQTPKFQCGHCGVKFAIKRNMKEHVLTHNKQRERPYSCEQCGRSFFTRADLKKHSPVHSSERPEQCSACGSKFKTRPNLRKHIRLVHAKKGKRSVPACGGAVGNQD